MEARTRRVLLIACAAVASASPAPAAEPVVTPAALLPRVDVQTLGWYSSTTVGGETLYAPWSYDADRTTYTTSGDWFRRCAVGSTCTMYTGCSDGYMVAAGTSTSCSSDGTSTGAYYCSNHVLLPSSGATSGRSWYWCDEAPLTGVTFFEREPDQPTATSSSVGATVTITIAGDEIATQSTSPSATSSTPSATATNSDPPATGGSSTNVGAIAGGVVGGVVVLALIGAAIFFMYRKKKNTAAGTHPPTGYAPPPNQPGYPASPNMGFATAYQANEAKPQGVQEMGGFYNQPPAPYPQGPYDPHMSQYGGGVPPLEAPIAQPQSSGTQPMPQEMPTSK